MAFDPLDGSSVVGANWAVGSIFGVFPGRHFLGRTGREQVRGRVEGWDRLCCGPANAVAGRFPSADASCCLATNGAATVCAAHGKAS